MGFIPRGLDDTPEEYISSLIELIWNWNQGWGEITDYWKILANFEKEWKKQRPFTAELNFLFNKEVQIQQKWAAKLTQIKEAKNNLATKLTEHETILTTTRQQLDQLKSELTKQIEEKSVLAEQLTRQTEEYEPN